jgi:hypothetical protein
MLCSWLVAWLLVCLAGESSCASDRLSKGRECPGTFVCSSSSSVPASPSLVLLLLVRDCSLCSCEVRPCCSSPLCVSAFFSSWRADLCLLASDAGIGIQVARSLPLSLICLLRWFVRSGTEGAGHQVLQFVYKFCFGLQ